MSNHSRRWSSSTPLSRQQDEAEISFPELPRPTPQNQDGQVRVSARLGTGTPSPRPGSSTGPTTTTTTTMATLATSSRVVSEIHARVVAETAFQPYTVVRDGTASHDRWGPLPASAVASSSSLSVPSTVNTNTSRTKNQAPSADEDPEETDDDLVFIIGIDDTLLSSRFTSTPHLSTPSVPSAHPSLPPVAGPSNWQARPVSESPPLQWTPSPISNSPTLPPLSLSLDAEPEGVRGETTSGYQLPPPFGVIAEFADYKGKGKEKMPFAGPSAHDDLGMETDHEESHPQDQRPQEIEMDGSSAVPTRSPTSGLDLLANAATHSRRASPFPHHHPQPSLPMNRPPVSTPTSPLQADQRRQVAKLPQRTANRPPLSAPTPTPSNFQFAPAKPTEDSPDEDLAKELVDELEVHKLKKAEALEWAENFNKGNPSTARPLNKFPISSDRTTSPPLKAIPVVTKREEKLGAESGGDNSMEVSVECEGPRPVAGLPKRQTNSKKLGSVEEWTPTLPISPTPATPTPTLPAATPSLPPTPQQRPKYSSLRPVTGELTAPPRPVNITNNVTKTDEDMANEVNAQVLLGEPIPPEHLRLVKPELRSRATVGGPAYSISPSPSPSSSRPIGNPPSPAQSRPSSASASTSASTSSFSATRTSSASSSTWSSKTKNTFFSAPAPKPATFTPSPRRPAGPPKPPGFGPSRGVATPGPSKGARTPAKSTVIQKPAVQSKDAEMGQVSEPVVGKSFEIPPLLPPSHVALGPPPPTTTPSSLSLSSSSAQTPAFHSPPSNLPQPSSSQEMEMDSVDEPTMAPMATEETAAMKTDPTSSPISTSVSLPTMEPEPTSPPEPSTAPTESVAMFSPLSTDVPLPQEMDTTVPEVSAPAFSPVSVWASLPPVPESEPSSPPLPPATIATTPPVPVPAATVISSPPTTVPVTPTPAPIPAIVITQPTPVSTPTPAPTSTPFVSASSGSASSIPTPSSDLTSIKDAPVKTHPNVSNDTVAPTPTSTQQLPPKTPIVEDKVEDIDPKKKEEQGNRLTTKAGPTPVYVPASPSFGTTASGSWSKGWSSWSGFGSESAMGGVMVREETEGMDVSQGMKWESIDQDSMDLSLDDWSSWDDSDVEMADGEVNHDGIDVEMNSISAISTPYHRPSSLFPAQDPVTVFTTYDIDVEMMGSVVPSPAITLPSPFSALFTPSAKTEVPALPIVPVVPLVIVTAPVEVLPPPPPPPPPAPVHVEPPPVALVPVVSTREVSQDEAVKTTTCVVASVSAPHVVQPPTPTPAPNPNPIPTLTPTPTPTPKKTPKRAHVAKGSAYWRALAEDLQRKVVTPNKPTSYPLTPCHWIPVNPPVPRLTNSAPGKPLLWDCGKVSLRKLSITPSEPLPIPSIRLSDTPKADPNILRRKVVKDVQSEPKSTTIPTTPSPEAERLFVEPSTTVPPKTVTPVPVVVPQGNEDEEYVLITRKIPGSFDPLEVSSSPSPSPNNVGTPTSSNNIEPVGSSSTFFQTVMGFIFRGWC